jgi:hypothetical protein
MSKARAKPVTGYDRSNQASEPRLRIQASESRPPNLGLRIWAGENEKLMRSQNYRGAPSVLLETAFEFEGESKWLSPNPL